jgi:hypothetical protein
MKTKKSLRKIFSTDAPIEVEGFVYNLLIYSPDEDSSVYAQIYNPQNDDVVWEQKLIGNKSLAKAFKQFKNLNYENN